MDYGYRPLPPDRLLSFISRKYIEYKKGGASTVSAADMAISSVNKAMAKSRFNRALIYRYLMILTEDHQNTEFYHRMVHLYDVANNHLSNEEEKSILNIINNFNLNKDQLKRGNE
ncbi:hypothetical protein [Priestia megaterium]